MTSCSGRTGDDSRQLGGRRRGARGDRVPIVRWARAARIRRYYVSPNGYWPMPIILEPGVGTSSTNILKYY